MKFIFIKGNTKEEFEVNLSEKLDALNSSYISGGIKTLELETESEVILYESAPLDDEIIWAADQDFALLYEKFYEEGFIEILWAKKKWVIGKHRTKKEIELYLDNESIDDRIFFVELEEKKVLH